ncbi:MAG TPA: hydrogenase maturation nickel metallochaperone HypA [bacterium]|nr:hydrogenase maturation nickel metallochaperone HypA [bacterium]
MTHELSLMAGLVTRLETLARAEGAVRVTRVVLRLGALAHGSPEHMREHFAAAARGTVAEGAEVAFEPAGDARDPRGAEVVLDRVDLEVPDD